MIIYNVTISVDKDVESDFMIWLKNIHIPEVLDTKLFLEYKLLRMIDEDNPNATTYAVQYSMESVEKFVEYADNYAPALQTKTQEKYGNKVAAFRTLLEVLD